MRINDFFCFSKTDKLRRAQIIVKRILPYLKNSKSIIDIGCGEGYIASLLMKHNREVTAVDINNRLETHDIKVILYDGKKLPFPAKKFQTSLLLTVLYHTPDAEIIFSEAGRVSREIIVIEDICNNLPIKLLSVFFDSLQNRPLRFYWNSYKSDLQWKTFFTKKGFKIKAGYYQDFPYLHGVYYLQKTEK